MAKNRHQQVRVGSTQPPFPGGWVSALLRTVRDCSEAMKDRYGLPKRSRTLDRLEDGKSEVKESTFRAWRAVLVQVVTELFPRVSRINDFAEKYVDEYFRLWALSAEHVPRWVEVGGHAPASRHVLGRALVRDLLLRLCYLESCERRLGGRTDTVLMQCSSIHGFYAFLIKQRAQTEGLSQEALVGSFGLDSTIFRRWKSGKASPSWHQLRKLAPAGDERMLAGARFIDLLLRRLGLRGDPLADELIQVAGIFGRTHATALDEFRGEVPIKQSAAPMRAVGFEQFARFGDNLLLHPGWQRTHVAMPDALWRFHMRSLVQARPFDLAQAYLLHSSPKTDESLLAALTNSKETDDQR